MNDSPKPYWVEESRNDKVMLLVWKLLAFELRALCLLGSYSLLEPFHQPYFFLFLAVMGFELRASCLVGECCAT
jgi:hypothetical protein